MASLAVLAACGRVGGGDGWGALGLGGAIVGMAEGVTERERRERDEGWKQRKTWLFTKSEPDLFHPQAMESTPIYRRWKRAILSSLEKYFGPWFGWEGLQPLV